MSAMSICAHRHTAVCWIYIYDGSQSVATPYIPLPSLQYLSHFVVIYNYETSRSCILGAHRYHNMPASQSHLPAGIGFVVAVTEATINSEIQTRWSRADHFHDIPVIDIYYINPKDPHRVDLAELEKLTTIPSLDIFQDANPTPEVLEGLHRAGFLAGFRVQVGMPPDNSPQSVVQLLTTGGASHPEVLFNMLFRQFKVVGFDSMGAWFSGSQGDDTWVFSATVDLRLNEKGLFSKLPTPMQARIKNLTNAVFSLEQLTFVLSNAGLMTSPRFEFSGPSTARQLVDKYFMGKYFTEKQHSGECLLQGLPIPNEPVAIDVGSTFVPTDMYFQVSPYIDPQSSIHNQAPRGIATLNYVCAVNGDKLGPPEAFKWNWLDKSDVGARAGAVSISRQALGHHMETGVAPYIDLITTSTSFMGWGMEIHPRHQDFTYTAIVAPSSEPEGSTLLIAKSILDPNISGARFQMTIKAGGGSSNSMTVFQTAKINVKFTPPPDHALDHYAATWEIKVDYEVQSPYTIGIKGNSAGVLANKSSPPGPIERIKIDGPSSYPDPDAYRLLKNVIDTDPLFRPELGSGSIVTFPGGQTFVFSDPCFTDSADLVAYIGYQSRE